MDKNSTYGRWENYRIAQLSFINNLIIALSVALIAYIFNFLKQPNVLFNYSQKILFWFGTLLIVISIIVGILIAINRLQDFRLTAQIARNREKNNRENIENDRNSVQIMGKKTWNGFICQILSFGISFLCFSGFFLIEYWDKLT